MPILFLVLFSGGGQILLKKGVADLTLGNFEFTFRGLAVLIFSIIQNFWLILGLFSLSIGFLLYLLLLSMAQLNTVYPVLVSGSIILITVVSGFLFQEVLSLPQIFGILIIIFGIFAMFFKRRTQAPTT